MRRAETGRLVGLKLDARTCLCIAATAHPLTPALLSARTVSELDARYSLAKRSSNHSWTLLTRLVSSER